MSIASTVDLKTAPVEQVKNMDAATFFERMCALMKDNPPATADAETANKFAAIGIVPGEDFEMERLDGTVVKGLERSVKAGYEQVVFAGTNPEARIKNNWLMTYDLRWQLI